MSTRLRMKLVAGIALQTRDGHITDPRYLSLQRELEGCDWQDRPVVLPPVPASDQGYEFWRYLFIQEHLLDRRDPPNGLDLSSVLFYRSETFPELLGFCIQTMPDIDLIGFALASIEERYAQPGYQELPTYQGNYRDISSLVPPEIQQLQRDVWAYSSFSDRMPGYFYTFEHLCTYIGFRLDPEDYSQVRLYLCWEWS